VTILDALLLALSGATIMRVGQRDALLDVLIATPLVIAVWGAVEPHPGLASRRLEPV
jgi:hypothetical protein